MLVKTHSAVMQGLQPVKIEVEVDATVGTPQFLIIGLPTKEIDEAKERITAALINCGVRPKARRTVVNLAPADVRKTGSGLELAIAVGLACLFQNLPAVPVDTMLFGELSLDGTVKPVRGAMPLVLAAKQMGFQRVIIPAGNVAEVRVLSGIIIHPVHHLQDVIAALTEQLPLPIVKHTPYQHLSQSDPTVDLADIVGQSLAKRAIEVAAAGGHNLFLVGPPGAGKSMLAQAVAGVSPPLSEQEAMELTSIYSVAGLLTQASGVITARPFRSPHHSTTVAGLTGGGSPILPGEISLAHRGVLFLDELPEFNRYCLEALRQPLEDRSITLTRATGTFHFPAEFALVAAANPCPCGYYGSQRKSCRCTRSLRRNYVNRLSGPLLDRIDVHLWVQELTAPQLQQLPTLITDNQETSATVRQRVALARERQLQRAVDWKLPVSTANADLTSKQLRTLLTVTPSARQLLAQATATAQLSARAVTRSLRVALTIADLANAATVDRPHLAEALQYRSVRWGFE